MDKDNKGIDKKQIKRNYFTLNVRKDAQSRIDEIEKMLGRKVTEGERKGLIYDAAKRVGKRVAVMSAIGLLSFGSINLFLNKEDKLLNPGSKVTIEETTKTPDPERETYQVEETKEQSFKSELQDFSNYNANIRSDIQQELESARDSKEDAIEYLKELYVSEYNENNDEKINKDNIKIWKRNSRLYGTALYPDMAENGATIIREAWEKDLDEKDIIKGASIIYVSIKTDNWSKEECITNYNNEYVPIYAKNEEVKEKGTNTLCEMGEVIDKGIIWASAIGEGQHDINVQVENSKKESDFINALTDYRAGKQEIRSANNQTKQNNLESKEER